MYILDACSDASFAATMLFIKKIINIIFIIAPILLILLLTIDFTKAVIANDENRMKQLKDVAIKRIVFAVILFFVPLIVDTSLGLLSGSNSKAINCYNKANESIVNSLVKKANEEKIKKGKDDKESILAIKEKQKTEATKRKANAARATNQQNSIGSLSVDSQYRKSNGKIAEATSAGSGNRYDRNRGDQNGKEVWITKNYGGWDYIGRFKDPEKASKAANCAQLAAANDNIGYSAYGDRCFTFEKELEKVNWDPTKITKKCDAVCSTFVSTCINASGVKVPYMTGGEGGKHGNKNVLKSSGAFIIMKYDKNNLMRGDVLVNTNVHTAMAM